MTVNEMLTELGSRLEDPAGDQHPTADKLIALNAAQTFVVESVIPPPGATVSYLTELETLKEDLALTAGISAALSATSLGAAPFGSARAIVRMRLSNKWSVPLPYDQIAVTRNYFHAPTTVDPRWYVSENKLICLPTSLSVADDVVFLKVPTALAASGSVDVNTALHPAIVDIAEAYRWRADEKAQRAEAAEEAGRTKIRTLMAVYGNGRR